MSISTYPFKKWAFFGCLLLIHAISFAQPGVLDPSFGINGKTITSFDSSASPTAIALQSDGKIVVAGFTGKAVTHFLTVRYKAKWPIGLFLWKQWKSNYAYWYG
jgi:hypothetical protein